MNVLVFLRDEDVREIVGGGLLEIVGAPAVSVIRLHVPTGSIGGGSNPPIGGK